MKDVIYLEPDIEITAVIDKIRKSALRAIILVVPRGSNLTQSIVNLKLLKRRAEDERKVIAIVSSDRITHNLAEQLKLHCYDKVTEAERANFAPDFEAIELADNGSGLKVHTYQKYNLLTHEEITEENQSTDSDLEDGYSDSDSELKNDQVVPEGFEKKKISEQEYTKDEMKEFEKSQLDDSKVDEIEREIKMKDRTRKIRQIRPEGSRKVFVVFVVAGLILFLGAAYLFLPTVEASVVLKSTEVNENLTITIDRAAKSSDAKSLVLAGKLVDLEKEVNKTFDATGKKDLGEKAKGKVIISNSWDMNDQSIPKGSKFISNGKTYVSTAAVTVPGATVTLVAGAFKTNAGSAEVAVEAETAGESYNIGASEFVITTLPKEKQSKIIGKSTVAFAGGTTKEVKVVTESDLEKAQEAIKKEALVSSTTELADKAKNDSLKIFDSAIDSEVLSLEPNKKADDQADTFEVKAKIKMFGLGFSELELKNLVKNGVESKLKSNEMIINPDGSEVAYEILESDINAGIIKVKTVYKGKYGIKIDQDSIKANIKGKSLSQGENYLKGLEGVESANIAANPGFIRTSPYFKNKITVKFDYSK